MEDEPIEDEYGGEAAVEDEANRPQLVQNHQTSSAVSGMISGGAGSDI